MLSSSESGGYTKNENSELTNPNAGLNLLDKILDSDDIFYKNCTSFMNTHVQMPIHLANSECDGLLHCANMCMQTNPFEIYVFSPEKIEYIYQKTYSEAVAVTQNISENKLGELSENICSYKLDKRKKEMSYSNDSTIREQMYQNSKNIEHILADSKTGEFQVSLDIDPMTHGNIDFSIVSTQPQVATNGTGTADVSSYLKIQNDMEIINENSQDTFSESSEDPPSSSSPIDDVSEMGESTQGADDIGDAPPSENYNPKSPLNLEEAITLRNKNIKNPTINYLNINSLRYKIHDLRYIISKLEPTILAVSETKLDYSFPDVQFVVDEYQNPGEYRKDRTKNGGGLIVFVRKGIPCERRPKFEPDGLEIVCMEISIGKRKWLVTSLYRSPVYSNLKEFFKELTQSLDKIVEKYDNILLLGDINIDTLVEKAQGRQLYEDFIDTFNLTNLIKTQTCFTKSHSSSIDVILTNKPRSFMHTKTIETGVSDVHTMVSSMFRAHVKRLEPVIIQYRDYKHYDEQAFIDDLQNQNMKFDENENPQSSYNKLVKCCQDTLNKHAPLKTKRIRGNEAPFMNKTLKKAIMTRSRARNKFNKHKCVANWEAYKKQRNLCTKIKRKSIKNHLYDITKDGDLAKKPFWTEINPYITNNGYHERADYMLLEENEIIRDKKQVADIFNNFYINIVESTTGKALPEQVNGDENTDIIAAIIDKYKNHQSITEIKERHILPKFEIPLATDEDILDIMMKINVKAGSGHDKIPPKVIKSCAHLLHKPIKNIINATINNSEFVNAAKIATVTPLYKSPKDGSRQSKIDYRPVSVLCIFSKIIERYYHNAMEEHTNKCLSKVLSAFRKGHSCENVLTRLTEEWRKHLDEDKIVGAVIIDLSKAFDCLPHDLLIAKLAAYNFDIKTLRLLYSYLKGRKQAVKINGMLSDLLEILSGVPQGSILGPILFNLFLNDLLYHIKSCNPHNFADDNALSAIADSKEELVKSLEKGSGEAINWLDENHMIANPGKTKGIILTKGNGNTAGINIAIKDKQIESKSEVELLGITVDNKLSFKKHVRELCKKAGGKLNALKRLGSYIPSEKARKAYVEAHVLSHFNYCSTVWHFCGLTETHKIEKLHERAIRFIYNDNITEYNTILKSQNIHTLYSQRIRTICCEIFKSKKGLNAAYMIDIFNDRPSTYPTRNPEDLYVPKANQKRYGYKSLRVEGPKVWNKLPISVRTSKTIGEFKNKIKTIDFPKCYCDKCFTEEDGT